MFLLKLTDELDLLQSKCIIYAEPVKLIGEGEYKNTLKDIVVTDSYLGLDMDVRNCQHEEPYVNCTTKKYLETFLGQCGCLPPTLLDSNNDSVSVNNFSDFV